MCLKRQSKKKWQVKSVNTSYLSQHYVTVARTFYLKTLYGMCIYIYIYIYIYIPSQSEMKRGRLQLEPMGALDTVVILVIAEN